LSSTLGHGHCRESLSALNCLFNQNYFPSYFKTVYCRFGSSPCESSTKLM